MKYNKPYFLMSKLEKIEYDAYKQRKIELVKMRGILKAENEFKDMLIANESKKDSCDFDESFGFVKKVKK